MLNVPSCLEMNNNLLSDKLRLPSAIIMVIHIFIPADNTPCIGMTSVASVFCQAFRNDGTK